jgi:vitamin B12 transporter
MSRDFVLYKTYLFFILASGLLGQTFHVQNKNGDPIPHAFIIHIQTENWAQSNTFGFTQFPFQLKKNDSLKISRFGYKTLFTTVENAEKGIILLVNPLQMKTIFSRGKKHPDTPNIFQEHSFEKSDKMGELNHENILVTLPGISLRTFGGPGSISTVSINGGPSTQTQIKVDDFNLTNVQTGVTDISQLPLPFIQNARLMAPGTENQGSGSQNGTLYLQTENRSNAFTTSSGSYGHQSNHLMLALSSNSVQTTFLIGNRNEQGNYPVTWKDQSFERKNNHFSQIFISYHAKAFLKKNLTFQQLGLISAQKRGVPGLLWSPSQARRKDMLFLLGSSFQWMYSLGDGNFQQFVRTSLGTYRDPTYAIDAEHTVGSIEYAIEQSIRFTSNIKSVFRGELHQEDIASSVFSQNRVDAVEQIDIHWNPISSISIHPSVRRDHSKALFDQSTKGINISYQRPLKIFHDLGFTSSSHFRYPTFNDLFWEPGGNPDLMPETGKQQSIHLRFNPKWIGQFHIHLFSSETYQLIQWAPFLTYWKPQNIEQAKRKGWTVRWKWQKNAFQSHLSLSAIKTENGIKKKPLRYAPSHLWTFTADWTPNDWHIHGQIHGTSSMISTYSWPDDIIIPAHALVSASMGKSFYTKWMEIITVFSIDNASNIQYESSKGYPEAGRSFRFTLTLKANKKGDVSSSVP